MTTWTTSPPFRKLTTYVPCGSVVFVWSVASAVPLAAIVQMLGVVVFPSGPVRFNTMSTPGGKLASWKTARAPR